jgi:hypothetical protein
VKAISNDDTAEDVAGGLRMLNGLNWLPGGKAARMAVLFGDSPAHGRAYHDMGGSADKRLDITEEEHLEPMMANFARRQIDFYMFRLTILTAKMEGVMKAAYDGAGRARLPFTVLPDLKADPVALLECLVKAATTSLRTARK